jgi:hypothetical protein
VTHLCIEDPAFEIDDDPFQSQQSPTGNGESSSEEDYATQIDADPIQSQQSPTENGESSSVEDYSTQKDADPIKPNDRVGWPMFINFRRRK